jgi:hypothetical protein
MAGTKYTNAEIWQRRGFLPFEVNALQELHSATMAKGRQAPFIRAMVRHRMAIVANARRYEWNAERFTDYIVSEYSRYGINVEGKNSYYDYLTAWKNKWKNNKGQSDDPHWTTPREKRRVTGEPKVQSTKRKMLFAQKDALIPKYRQAIQSGNDKERRAIERENNRLQYEIDSL